MWYSSYSGKFFSIVYQLNTKKDSIILWKNGGVANNNNKFQMHIIIPKQNISDAIINFKSYFLNKKKQEFNYNKLKVLIYQE